MFQDLLAPEFWSYTQTRVHTLPMVQDVPSYFTTLKLNVAKGTIKTLKRQTTNWEKIQLVKNQCPEYVIAYTLNEKDKPPERIGWRLPWSGWGPGYGPHGAGPWGFRSSRNLYLFRCVVDA